MKKLYRSISLVLATVMLCGCLTSCGSSKLRYPDGVETYEFTDDYGRTVELRKDITKIVASGPNTQLILYTIAPDLLVGLAESPSTSNRKYYPAEYADLPTLGQFYGKKTSLNLENLMATEAELIIDVGEKQDSGKKDMDAIQKQTGIATIFIEGTLDNYDEAYEKLGKVLRREEQAKALAEYCRETIELAEAAKKQIKKEKTVYFGVDSTGLNANVQGNIQAAVIEAIGAKNAITLGDDEEVVGKNGGNPVDLEEVYKVEPDYIILGPDGPYEKLRDANSQWKGLKAVIEGRYYEVPSGPYSWMSAPPNVNQILGIRWLGNIVYPEYYKNNIREDAKEYYKLFWHYDLSDAELNALLARSAKK